VVCFNKNTASSGVISLSVKADSRIESTVILVIGDQSNIKDLFKFHNKLKFATFKYYLGAALLGRRERRSNNHWYWWWSSRVTSMRDTFKQKNATLIYS
jgi:hypothetical protein